MEQPLFRSQPHPLTLFSLIPLQSRTVKDVLHLPDNQHLVSIIPDVPSPLNVEDSAIGINIGFHIGSKSSHTIATIGRNGDISVRGASISRVQCSFEINVETHEVLLCDQSSAWSTQTFGKDATPFEWHRPDRRVVVARGINESFGFGGVGRDLFQFRIHWHEQPPSIEAQLTLREDHPRLMRTVDDQTPTAFPSRRNTRIHTPSRTPFGQETINQIRYHKRLVLGAGSFGEVWKVVDLDTGRFLAVKLLHRPKDDKDNTRLTFVRREVEALKRVNHPHIVELISAQTTPNHVELFSLVQDGSVQDLISRNVFTNDDSQAERLLHHMLQALDYLDTQHMIHRDLKPANILYSRMPEDQRVFQLADFGLCTLQKIGKTYVGTPMYMAPEMWADKGAETTSKTDIWSLFVTLAEALDAAGFQQRPKEPYGKLLESIQKTAQLKPCIILKDMAIVDPEKRASAGTMLENLFAGKGRLSRYKVHAVPVKRLNKVTHLDVGRKIGATKPALLGKHRTRDGRRPIEKLL